MLAAAPVKGKSFLPSDGWISARHVRKAACRRIPDACLEQISCRGFAREARQVVLDVVVVKLAPVVTAVSLFRVVHTGHDVLPSPLVHICKQHPSIHYAAV